jgi:hypothetical protein
MKLIAVFALFIVLGTVGSWLRSQRNEWKGVWLRYRQGKPLRWSEAHLQEAKEARVRLHEEALRMRHAYELSPANILNKQFRDRFKELGIDQQIRAEVRVKHGNICRICKKKIRNSFDLCIDHIKPMKHHPQLEFWITNLQVLCRSCNSHKSAYDGWNWEEVVIERKKNTLRQKRQRARLGKLKNPLSGLSPEQE